MNNQTPAQTSADQMRRWIGIARWITIISGGVLLAGLVIFGWLYFAVGGGFSITAFFACVLGATGVLVGVLTYFNARAMTRQLDEMVSGQNVLALWTYTPDEWGHFAEHEAARSRKVVVVTLLLIFVPAAILIAYALISTGGSFKIGFFPLLLQLMPLALLALLVWFIVSKSTNPSQQRGPGDVCISQDGALVAGRFYSWNTLGARLTSVSYEDGSPPVIVFNWMQPGTGARGNSMPKIVRVPVPRGHEDEARALVASFQLPQ